MGRNRRSAEETVNNLREVEVHLAQGRTMAHACQQIAINDQTFYPWRRE